jgi:hypothetical protein
MACLPGPIAGEAAMTALSSNKRRLKCPVCERTIERKSRQQTFCSTQCRMKAFREKTPVGSGYTGGVTNPPNFSSQNNILQWPKTGSSLSANGPLNLLGGGSWKWSGAGVLDSKTLAKIKRSEVGGELKLPPEGDAP